MRAFEVEHSTAVYSGLLRMADLLALSQIWTFDFISLLRMSAAKRFSGRCGARCSRSWSGAVVA